MKKSRLLNEVHETALGLARIGAIDKHTLRELDALCLPPVRELSAKQIRAIRSRAQMSQAVFAAVLNTSVSTVQKWEIGEKRPSGPSLKLLNVRTQRRRCPGLGGRATCRTVVAEAVIRNAQKQTLALPLTKLTGAERTARRRCGTDVDNQSSLANLIAARTQRFWCLLRPQTPTPAQPSC